MKGEEASQRENAEDTRDQEQRRSVEVWSPDLVAEPLIELVGIAGLADCLATGQTPSPAPSPHRHLVVNEPSDPRATGVKGQRLQPARTASMVVAPVSAEVGGSPLPRWDSSGDQLLDHLGEMITGCLRSKNSVSPTLSLFISSIWACSSGGISLRSPSRASASEVKYMTMV
jgi:hypothetical protein